MRSAQSVALPQWADQDIGAVRPYAAWMLIGVAAITLLRLVWLALHRLPSSGWPFFHLGTVAIGLGMGAMVSTTKDFLGKRSLSRSDTAAANRKQLVGLEHVRPEIMLPEGSIVLSSPSSTAILGHVTSSYISPILGRSIAMGTVRDGIAKMGEFVTIALPDGSFTSAKITGTVFYDKEGKRQHVE